MRRVTKRCHIHTHCEGMKHRVHKTIIKLQLVHHHRLLVAGPVADDDALILRLRLVVGGGHFVIIIFLRRLVALLIIVHHQTPPGSGTRWAQGWAGGRPAAGSRWRRPRRPPCRQHRRDRCSWTDRWRHSSPRRRIPPPACRTRRRRCRSPSRNWKMRKTLNFLFIMKMLVSYFCLTDKPDWKLFYFLPMIFVANDTDAYYGRQHKVILTASRRTGRRGAQPPASGSGTPWGRTWGHRSCDPGPGRQRPRPERWRAQTESTGQ